MTLPDLPANTILQLEVGSTAHGISVGNDDLDMFAVAVETFDQLLGLAPPLKTRMDRTAVEGETSKPGDVDRTLYSLRSFAKLLLDGNPSILVSLWCPVLDATDHGRALVGIASSFVGRHMVDRFLGYAHNMGLQVLGLRKGHGTAGRASLIAEHSYDTKAAAHALRLFWQCQGLVDDHDPTLRSTQRTYLRRVRSGEVPFDEWWGYCEDAHENLEAVTSSWLRPGPDRETVGRVVRDIHRDLM